MVVLGCLRAGGGQYKWTGQHIVKMAVLVEVGIQMNTFPSDSSVASDPAWAVEWIELPRGLSLSSLESARTLRGWSRSPRPSSVDSQDLPEVLGLFCACLGDVGGGRVAFTFRVRVTPLPIPASPSCSGLSFSCKRRRYPAGRPRSGLLCSAWRQRAGLLAPSVLTSAHPRPYPGRPCCMVMGCQGDIHLFLWARAAAARSVAPAWMAVAVGSEGREGERTRKHPADSPSHRPGQRLSAPIWRPFQPGTEGEGLEDGPEVKGQVEAACARWNQP